MAQIKIIDDLDIINEIEEDYNFHTYCWHKSTTIFFSTLQLIDSFLDNFGNRFDDFVKYSKDIDKEHPELIYQVLFDY